MSRESVKADTANERSRIAIGSFSIPREFAWALLLLFVLILGLAVSPSPWAVYRNDPIAFGERSRPFLDGQLPYIDFEFEHLPLAFVPMLAAALLETFLPLDYIVIFWIVMSGVLFGCGATLARVGRKVGVTDAALRWVLISWAILPLLSFRLDALSVLLTLMALLGALHHKDTRSAWAMAGAIAAKGWPIVLSVVDWWRGRRRRAVMTVALTVGGVIGLTLFPLFRSGRTFSGVHMETLTGALVALARILTGSSAQVSAAAGASYVEVGVWALIVNALVGAGLGLVALRVLQAPFNWRRALDLVGVLSVAMMLLSPLLSAQFIIWATPFAALSSSRRVQTGMGIVALLTGVFVTFWFIDHAWWWAVIVARNVVLVWTGWSWAIHLHRSTPGISDPVAKRAAA